MTNKSISTNKPIYIALITVTFLVFTFVFYWLQIRPVRIRSKCAIEAENLEQKEASSNIDYYKLLTGSEGKNLEKSSEIYDENYKTCLHRHGL